MRRLFFAVNQVLKCWFSSRSNTRLALAFELHCGIMFKRSLDLPRLRSWNVKVIWFLGRMHDRGTLLDQNRGRHDR